MEGALTKSKPGHREKERRETTILPPAASLADCDVGDGMGSDADDGIAYGRALAGAGDGEWDACPESVTRMAIPTAAATARSPTDLLCAPGRPYWPAPSQPCRDCPSCYWPCSFCVPFCAMCCSAHDSPRG